MSGKLHFLQVNYHLRTQWTWACWAVFLTAPSAYKYPQWGHCQLNVHLRSFGVLDKYFAAFTKSILSKSCETDRDERRQSLNTFNIHLHLMIMKCPRAGFFKL